MRAAYRAIEPDVKKGKDIIFVARNSINGCKEPEVEKNLRKTLGACGLLTDSRKNNEG